nr:MAG: RNA dependent RNA polymerase [Leviviridae sp.]
MKRPNRATRYHKVNRSLSATSLNAYWAVIRKLSSSHEFPRKKEFTTACAARDVPKLMDLADFLSEQKYPDAYTHYVGNQIAALVRKFPFPGFEKKFKPKEVAFQKFIAAEQRCSRYNKLFALRVRKNREKHAKDFYEMRAFIQYVLGSKPNMRLIFAECGFGPGASIGTHGNATNAGRKLSGSWTCSPSARSYFAASVLSNSFMRRACFPLHDGFSDGTGDLVRKIHRRCKIVLHNKIEFVPKTTRTFRSIAVEPLGNGFVQKGVDQVMRKHLKRIGLDLGLQAPNQEMARQGSLDDSPQGFCTIDLSSASDSISIELVRNLLPPEWFELLNSLRSKSFEYDGEIRTYEKFCSMGNGFCFPLQTLLFAAACHACDCGRPNTDFRVYGDDIIVRQAHVGAVLKLLRRMGFRENASKTHVSGPFRESCGADWFGGVDVRPYNLDDHFNTIENHFKFLNALRSRPLWETFFEPVREFILARLPQDFHFFRPFTGPSDTGLDCDDAFLTCRHVRYLGSGVWRWRELAHSALPDKGVWLCEGLQIALEWYAVFQSVNGSTPYTLRRKTRTTVRWESHGGATSRWSPGTDRCEAIGWSS